MLEYIINCKLKCDFFFIFCCRCLYAIDYVRWLWTKVQPCCCWLTMECMLIFGSWPYNHFKISGQLKRMIAMRRIKDDASVKIGVSTYGKNKTVYFAVD